MPTAMRSDVSTLPLRMICTSCNQQASLINRGICGHSKNKVRATATESLRQRQPVCADTEPDQKGPWDCMPLGIETPLPPGSTASNCTTHRHQLPDIPRLRRVDIIRPARRQHWLYDDGKKFSLLCGYSVGKEGCWGMSASACVESFEAFSHNACQIQRQRRRAPS